MDHFAQRLARLSRPCALTCRWPDPVQRSWLALSRGIRKNGDRRPKRATSIRTTTTPTPTMPTTDQICDVGGTFPSPCVARASAPCCSMACGAELRAWADRRSFAVVMTISVAVLAGMADPCVHDPHAKFALQGPVAALRRGASRARPGWHGLFLRLYVTWRCYRWQARPCYVQKCERDRRDGCGTGYRREPKVLRADRRPRRADPLPRRPLSGGSRRIVAGAAIALSAVPTAWDRRADRHDRRPR